MKEYYTLGFVFNADASKVLLIEREKDDWQKGKLNGLGGKLEGAEHPRLAMSREFLQESGIDCPPGAWHAFGIHHGDGFQIYLFTTEFHGDFQPKCTAEGRADFYEVDRLPANILPNTKWMIDMARSFRMGETARGFEIREHAEEVQFPR